MKKNRVFEKLWWVVIFLLCSLQLTGCWWDSQVVLPDSRVQKMSKGQSANFDGYLLTNGALVGLYEKAKACQKGSE